MTDNEIDRWSEFGSGLAGSLTGAAIGAAATGDPGMAIAEAAAGSVVEAALLEAKHRIMSHRQKQRVGAVVIIARRRLIEKVGEGKVLRTDDFIRARVDGRSPADEVIEHVIQVSQKTFEERKLPYIAAVYATIAVSPEIDEATAHWAINSVDSLSWHKLVALAAVGIIPERDRPGIDPTFESVTPSSWPLRRAIFELFNTDRLLAQAKEQEEGTFAVGTPIFSEVKLAPAGDLLFRLAELTKMPREEVDALIATLRDSAVHEEA